MERDSADGVTRTLNVDFNSHAHVERDVNVIDNELMNLISTHTLTWSVTRVESPVVVAFVNFNSHAHVERDT